MILDCALAFSAVRGVCTYRRDIPQVMVLLAKSFFHLGGISIRDFAFLCAFEVVYHQLLPVFQCLSEKSQIRRFHSHSVVRAHGICQGARWFVYDGEAARRRRSASWGAHLAVEELLYGGQALLAVDATAHLLTVRVPVDREDDGRDVVVAPYRVEQLALFRL